jgi:hypothetical protein
MDHIHIRYYAWYGLIKGIERCLCYFIRCFFVELTWSWIAYGVLCHLAFYLLVMMTSAWLIFLGGYASNTYKTFFSRFLSFSVPIMVLWNDIISVSYVLILWPRVHKKIRIRIKIRIKSKNSIFSIMYPQRLNIQY